MKKKTIVCAALLLGILSSGSCLFFALSIPYCDECNEGSTHPHPSDPNKYYHCQNGTAVLKACATGLHYNPNTGDCDYPENI